MDSHKCLLVNMLFSYAVFNGIAEVCRTLLQIYCLLLNSHFLCGVRNHFPQCSIGIVILRMLCSFRNGKS